MRQGLRTVASGLALMAFPGAWGVAEASPADEPSSRRTLRLEAPFVPSIDPAEIPGFQMKIRGERIVYCRTEKKTGTRFKSETCIDQANMDAYLEALEENQRLVRELPSTGETRIN